MRSHARPTRRWRTIVLTLVLSSAWLSARTIQEPADLDVLRRDVLARFDVVPLREGVALAGRTADRRVEVVDGLVLAGGAPVSGAELVSRLGTDAGLVMKLSYLSNAELKQLFGPRSAVTSPGAVTSSRPAAPSPQTPTPPAAPAAPGDVRPPPAQVSASPPAATSRTYRRTGTRMGLGKSVTIAEDEDVTSSVVAILGDITVSGRVRDDVVAVGGNVTLTPTADVRGDITSVGGTVSVAPGATHRGRVHSTAIGRPGWRWPRVSWSRLSMDPATRWLTLAGTVTRVLLLSLIVGAIVVFARSRVGRVGAAVTATPIRAAAVGLGAQVLFVPALALLAIGLAITIVGLPFLAIIIPLALLAMLAAMLLGIASLAEALGRWVAGRFGWEAESVTWAIGLGVVVLPTLLSRMVGVGPNTAGVAVALLALGTVVEYMAWTVGLGAAILTGLGRWSTVPPPLPGPSTDAATL